MSDTIDSINAWLALPTDSEECEREYDHTDNEWECLNDITSCAYNDGHNLCSHDGDSRTPLEDAASSFELSPFFPTKNNIQ